MIPPREFPEDRPRAPCATSARAAAIEQPNIIVIMADDMGVQRHRLLRQCDPHTSHR
jgi:hypothetical protein